MMYLVENHFDYFIINFTIFISFTKIITCVGGLNYLQIFTSNLSSVDLKYSCLQWKGTYYSMFKNHFPCLKLSTRSADLVSEWSIIYICFPAIIVHM